MKKTAELDREPVTVDDIEYTVTEIVWDDGGRSFDVYIDRGLLTENESLDHYPTEEDVRVLYDPTDADTFPTATCGCGHEITRTPDGWQHEVAPWFWGNDHDPDPQPTARGRKPEPIQMDANTTYTLQQVQDAINKAIHDIDRATNLPDNCRDTLNLSCNATLSFLDGSAKDLDEVIAINYKSPRDAVLSWVEGG